MNQIEKTSFSSYTKGLFEVAAVNDNISMTQVTLKIPDYFQAKLEKRFKKFDCQSISLDGVFAKVTVLKSPSKEGQPAEIIAEIAKSAFLVSSLKHLQIGDKISLGMLQTSFETPFIC